MFHRETRTAQIYLALCLLLNLLSPRGAFAQIRSGSITGIVTDPSGSPIGGAKIDAVQTETKTSYKTTTSSSGSYTVPYLESGDYTVNISATGFPAFHITEVSVKTAETTRTDVQLKLGTLATSVEVTASAGELQTERATVQSATDQKIIEEVSNITHNPFYYAMLLPGVVPRAEAEQTQSMNSFGIGIDGRRTFSAIAVNGGQAFTNDIQVDGVSVQGSAWNEAAVVPNTEGIQEVRVQTNNFSAEYGRAQGVIQVATKSGTNEYHGSAFFRLRNEALNANSFANNLQGITRPPFKSDSYGGTFGGPMRKNKAFFFVSYEGLYHTAALDYLETVPTALERQGNFSQTLVNTNGVPTPVVIYNPFDVTQTAANSYQRATIPDSIIPPSQIYGPAAHIYSFYPLPNRTPIDPYNTQNYYNRASQSFNRNSINSRIDYRWGKLSIYGTGGLTRSGITTPGPWGSGSPFYSWEVSTGYNTTGGVGVGNTVSDRNPFASIGDTIILSPTVLIDFRYGVNRINANNEQSAVSNFDYASFGIPANFQVLNAVPDVPFDFSAGTNLTPLNWSHSLHKRERQLNQTMVGSVTKVLSRWTLKFGGEARVYLSNYTDAEESFYLENGSSGAFPNVSATGGSIGSLAANLAGWGMASTLLGAGDIYVAPGRSIKPALSQKYGGLYAQNDWRATSRLTVNLGVRWEVQPAPTERYDRESGFEFGGTNPYGGAGGFAFTGTNGHARNMWPIRWKDFSPRVGLAYRIGDKTVIRSGYGISYLPTNTGYFDGPFAYGENVFSAYTNAQPYGPRPAGVLVGTYGQVSQIVPVAGANPANPTLYGGSPGTFFDARDYLDGMSQQYNFFIDRRIGRNYMIEAGYVGSHGTHLPFARVPLNSSQFFSPATLASWQQAYVASGGKTNLGTSQVPNPYQPATGSLIPFKGDLGTSTISLAESLFPYPVFQSTNLERTIGVSRYNALQLVFRRTFSNGLLFTANYTWSKSTDFTQTEAQTNGFSDTGGYDTTDMDLLNYRNNKKLSTSDVPHRLVANWVYELPFGKGKPLSLRNRYTDGVLGGWRVSGTLTMQSGFPLEISASTGAANLRPMINSGVPFEVPKALQHWYDGKTTVTLPSGQQITPCNRCFLKYSLDAFSSSVVTLPDGTSASNVYWWGNAALDYSGIRGPGRKNTNMSVTREFRVVEKKTLEVSASVSNAFNNVEWTRNDITVGLGGVNTAASTARGIVPGSFNNNNFGTRGIITYEPRQVELQARFRF